MCTYIYIYYTELLGFVSSSWPTARQRNGSLGQLSGQSLEPCGSMAVETPRESAPHLAVHSANRPSKTRSGRANSCHESFRISVLRSLRRVQNDLEWKGCMDTNDNRNYWSCCARKNAIFKIMQRKIVNAEWSNPRLINRFSYCTTLGLTLLCQAFQQLSVLLAMGPRKSVPIRQRESDIAHNPLGEISSSARATPLSARATKQPALVLLPGFLGNIAFSET